MKDTVNVYGEDGRLIERGSRLDDARGTALRVHEASGETVKLTDGKNEEFIPAKAEKPKSEKPKGEKPKGEKPKGEKPKGEKPKGEKPKGEKPAAGKNARVKK